DRVTGATQDLRRRDSSVARTAMRRHLSEILAGPDAVREEAVRIIGRLGLKESGPALVELLGDKHASTKTRVQTLDALEALNDNQLPQAIRKALTDADPQVRNAGRRALAKRQPVEAIAELRSALGKGQIIEQQTALTLLGESPEPAADEVLSQWLNALLA